MTSSAKAAIERLIAIVEERSGQDELEAFLSTEKGFNADLIEIRRKSPVFVSIYMYISAIHYVAGKQFESAEEADEWLGYLVLERKQNIDEEEASKSRSPLHCACKWGNIIGVKWLVHHGASLNAEDDDFCTPYSLAFESSIDRRAKILFLEEQGYNPSPNDLCSAAESQYSSPGAAHEVLHYLTFAKGISVNSVRNAWDQATPLHCACESGNFFVVEWLVEHNAALNNVNDFGATPLMLACTSRTSRLSIVRYLSEKGADISAKDEDGENALFYAVDDERTPEDEVEWVLRFLVVEKCMDINSSDETGGTVFMKACSNHALNVLSILLSLGADTNAKDSMGRNAFHRVAISAYPLSLRSFSLFDIMDVLGVDVTCEDKAGMAPYQVADDPSIRTLFRQYYDDKRFAVFVREKVRPNSVKMCVMGSEMAGKTTFVNSLLQLNLPPIDPKDRTAGIEIHSVEIPGVGKGTIWDFGAQSTFQGAHGLFFRPSNTMLVLVLCFRKGPMMTSEVLLLQKGRYWCAFAKASLRTSHEKLPIRLSLVFNLIDVEEDEGIEVSFQLKRVALLLQEDFRDTFTISNVIEIDCSKSQSDRMKDCRKKLKKLREEILEAVDDVPKLCQAIEETLSSSDEEKDSSLSCFMTPDEFQKWVAKDVRVYLSAKERKISVEFLDSSGIIVDLDSRICLRPIWLCRNVIGPLLAPPYFPFGMPAEKFGTVSKNDMESALRAFENDLKKKGTPSPYSITVDEALQILLHLELCIKVKDATEVYQIPALLQGSIPSDAWNEDPKLDMYRGQRYECVHSVDIISPSSFVVFQSRCFYMLQTSHKAWKDGVKLVRIVGNKVVECLVNLGIRKEHCCIDVVLRWSNASGSEEVAETFLGDLKQMIVAVCNEKSPGVRFAWFYLESAYLKRLDEDPAIYLSCDVDRKVFENAFDEVLFSSRPKRSSYSAVKDLVIMGHTKIHPASSVAKKVSSCRKKRAFKKAQSPLHHKRSFEGEARVDPTSASSAKSAFPTDENSVSIELIRACAAVKGSKWEEVGVYLLTVDDLDEIRKSYGGNNVRMVRVLELWKTAKSPTVGQLLKWFEQVGVNRSHIERKYDELLS